LSSITGFIPLAGTTTPVSGDIAILNNTRFESSTHPDNYIELSDGSGFMHINSGYTFLTSSDIPGNYSSFYQTPVGCGFDLSPSSGSIGASGFGINNGYLQFYVYGSSVNQYEIKLDTTGVTFGQTPVNTKIKFPTSGEWEAQLPNKSGTFAMLDDIGTGSGITSLTTAGTSGVATFSGGVLNIPNYTSTGGLTSIGLSQSGSEFVFSSNPRTTNGNIGINLNTNGIAYSKIQQVAASRLLGNATGSTANAAEIPLGNGLGFSSGSLKVNAAGLTGMIPFNNGGNYSGSFGLVWYDSKGKLAIGGQSYFGADTSNIALVNIGPGNSTQPPLYFANSSSLLVTPLNGAVEKDASHIYYTSGGVRRQLDNQAELLSIGTFSTTGNAKGLSVSSGQITGHAATETQPGMLAVGTQIFPDGDKTIAQNGADPVTGSMNNAAPSYDFTLKSTGQNYMYTTTAYDWSTKADFLSSYTGSKYSIRLNGTEKFYINEGGGVYANGFQAPYISTRILATDGTIGTPQNLELRSGQYTALEIPWMSTSGGNHLQLGATGGDPTFVVATTISSTDIGMGFQVQGNAQFHFINGGISLDEGTNKTMGVVTLSSGTATVNTTKVTSVSRIYLTSQSGATVASYRISARSAGTSFTITSSSGSDTNVIAWHIIEPN
jgi:hypothetical protein